jgi:hypothetical protein
MEHCRAKLRAQPLQAHRYRLFARKEIVRKKKPVDPIRQAQKNKAHRIGWAIAAAGIVVGFVLVLLKPMA